MRTLKKKNTEIHPTPTLHRAKGGGGGWLHPCPCHKGDGGGGEPPLELCGGENNMKGSKFFSLKNIEKF